MKKPRELFETELAEIREELLRLGVRPRENPTERAASVKSEEQIVTPPEMMTAAYELAGYAVATRALGRSIPEKVVLKEDSEYDLGTCSEPELGTIWAVGHASLRTRYLTPAWNARRVRNNQPLYRRSCSKTGSRPVAIGLIACSRKWLSGLS
jgi:hypothetical protein